MATDEAATAAETLSLLQTLVTSVQELSAASSLQQEKNDEFARRLAELGEGVNAASEDAAESKAAALAASAAVDKPAAGSGGTPARSRHTDGPPPTPAEAREI